VLQILIEIALLVATGAVCRRLNVLNETGTQQLSRLVLWITLPVALFVSAAQSDLADLVTYGPVAFTAGALVPLFGYAIGALTARLLGLGSQQASVVRVNAAFSNTAFVGIPVCTALWGPKGALLAALFDQGLNLPLFTLAPWGYGQSSNGQAWRQILTAPMVWGMVLGIAWNLLGLELWAWLAKPLGALGSTTAPLSLMLVGAMARRAQVETRMAPSLAAYLGTRLILVPAAVLAVMLALGFDGLGAAVTVVMSAMPASVIATVMAEEYGADAALAGTGALLSVLVSLLTIPLVAAAVNAFL
jgi:predicted permease